MLNLLISADPKAWEASPAYFERDRCLTEYIAPELRSRFSALGLNEIERLKTMPTIFAYEKFNRKDAYIGRITGISVRQQNVKIEYEFSGERICFEDFISLKDQLDLGGWELNRTHWTVKNVDMPDIEPYFSSNRGHKPNIFVSYCWTPIENQRNVFSLIERLRADDISCVYDKKDLRPGQDKDFFMEQALTNHEIDKVLVICNQDYAEKANVRKGGVGRESEIIVSQISSQPLQTKFIPVVMETDENGEAFLPTFLMSRVYIDLTRDDGYNKLLAAIRASDNEDE
jgi:hypothetical protein